MLTAEQAIGRGMMAEMAENARLINELGRPAHAQALGLTVTDFPTWAGRTFGR